MGKKFGVYLVVAAILFGTFIVGAPAVQAATPIYVNTATGNDSWPGTTTTSPVKKITKGIELVDTGGTVNVAAGTYIESNILVDKSLTIQGVGATRDDVVVAPAAEDANADNAFGDSAQNGFVIKAHNVTIKNLTINGRGNPLLTLGKNNFRAGIVTLDASQSGGGAWNNLLVDNVVVKYIYRRGISVFPRSVYGTVIQNSRVEYVAFNHGMYLGGQSQAINNTVKQAFQGIVQDPDATTLNTVLIKANGNTLTDIGNFAGCWGYPKGQPRAIQCNPTGPARAFEVKDNTVSDNGLESYGGAVGVYTRLWTSDSVLSGNDITLSSGVSGSQAVGMLLGWNYDEGFTVANNHVHSSKYGIGMMVFGSGSAAKPMNLIGNTITSAGSAALATGDGSGIYVANQYLFASDKSPSYLVVSNGNAISGFVKGINAELISTSTQPLTLIANYNSIAGNTTGIDASTLTAAINATCNWWGSNSGPGTVGPGTGDKVSANVNFTPWATNTTTTATTNTATTLTFSEGTIAIGTPGAGTGAGFPLSGQPSGTANPGSIGLRAAQWWDISFTPSGYSTGSVTITVAYHHALGEETFRLYYWDGAAWQLAGNQVNGGHSGSGDVLAHYIRGTVPVAMMGGTGFGLFGNPSAMPSMDWWALAILCLSMLGIAYFAIRRRRYLQN